MQRKTIAFPEFEPEVPRNLPPSYLVSAVYDKERMVAALKLYEPSSGKIYFWFDNTGHKPYCYSDLSMEELQRIPELMRQSGLERFVIVRKRDPLFDRESEFVQIVAKDPLSIGGPSRKAIRNLLPKAWEADIKYYENYLYDRHLIPCIEYEIRNGDLVPVKLERTEEVEEVLSLLKSEEPEFKEQLERWVPILNYPIPSIRRVALDIEVSTPYATRLPDPRAAEYPIVCVSFVGSDGLKQVLVLRRPGLDEVVEAEPGVEVKMFDSEAELLIETFKTMLEYPFIITFNGDEFDLNYIWHRALKLGFARKQIPIELGRGSARVKHGVHIDVCKFFFNKSIQTYAFEQRYREVALDNVAKELLGIEKMKLEKPISELSYDELIAYCLRDSELTYKLTSFDDDLVMKLIVLLSRITFMTIEDVTRMGVSNWIRSMMIYEHRRRNTIVPRAEDLTTIKGVTVTKAVIEGKKYRGAVVVEPKAGIHFNVEVLDFASLYPSIIKRWNLSYETVLCPHPECRDNMIPETTYWACKKTRGISSLLIGSLRELRIRWYKPRSKDPRVPAETRNFYKVIQQALKVILNASYGVFGAEHFALFCPPVAESTAAIGRSVITKTIEKARSLGIEVIYGDTDSIFLKEPTSERIQKLIDWAKHELGLDLDIDKVYRYVAFSSRKKNYLGVYPDGSVDIKGLVGKKRHIPAFLKQAFLEMVRTLSEVKSEEEFQEAKSRIERIVREVYTKLKGRAYPLEDLAINIMLGKLPEKYKETVPQHVKAALLLTRMGYELRPGDIIAFVKVKGEPRVKPVQLASVEEVDAERYIDMLESTFSQVLDAMGLDFYSIIGFTTLEYFL